MKCDLCSCYFLSITSPRLGSKSVECILNTASNCSLVNFDLNLDFPHI